MKKISLDLGPTGNTLTMKKVRVVVITTVMLSFISYWRASAIVLSDLASSAYYALGIAVKAVGPSAPWFILFVMVFAYGIRAVYIESASMFVRGGSTALSTRRWAKRRQSSQFQRCFLITLSPLRSVPWRPASTSPVL